MRKWDLRFLQLCDHIAAWSKDPSTKVGAVITRENKIISLGYNGFPQKINDTEKRLNFREMKLRITIHAELNAILAAKTNLDGCIMYCNTPPCTQCAANIIQTGITKCIYYSPNTEYAKRWKLDIKLTKEILTEAGIVIIEVDKEDDLYTP